MQIGEKNEDAHEYQRDMYWTLVRNGPMRTYTAKTRLYKIITKESKHKEMKRWHTPDDKLQRTNHGPWRAHIYAKTHICVKDT